MPTRGFGKAIKNVDSLKEEIKDRTEDALEESLSDTKQAMRRHLVQNNSDASDKLYDNLRVRDGDITGARIASKKITAPQYWAYLEFGTGSYGGTRHYEAASPYPPYDVILDWVQAQGITPSATDAAENQEDVAYAIQRSLTTGSHSHPFVRPAWRGPAGKDHLVSSIESAIKKAIRRA